MIYLLIYSISIENIKRNNEIAYIKNHSQNFQNNKTLQDPTKYLQVTQDMDRYCYIVCLEDVWMRCEGCLEEV